MVWDVLLTIFLVMLNGFFVASEFAIVRIRASQIELKLRSGHRLAKIAKNIHDHMDEYLSATQLGVTLASLALGWIGESVLAKSLLVALHWAGLPHSEWTAHTIAFPLAFCVITVLHIVLGELIPKSMAIGHPVATTFAVVVPLRLFYFAFSPFIRFFNGMAVVIMKGLGIRSVDVHNAHSVDEIKILLEEGEQTGLLKGSEHDIIRNVFYSSSKTVKQIMVPRLQIEAVSLAVGWDSVVQKFVQEGYTRLPVYKDSLENIVGVLYAKDFLKGLTQPRFNWKDNIQKPYFVPESKKIIELLREFQTEHQHMAIVLDEFGSTVGLVTFEDILEELVGEIQDEYDKETPMVEVVEEARIFKVNAGLAIDELNESLPVPIPESPHYDTVAGFVNMIFKRIPQPGDKYTWGGYEWQVLKGTKRRVELVKIIKK